MIRREQRLNQIVKQYDPYLFIMRGSDEKLYLHRNVVRWDSYDVDGSVLHCSRLDPVMIMALTDTWTPQGKSVDWGIEPLLMRLKEIDSHRSHEIIDRINMAQELREESAQRKLANNTDSFAREIRTAVKQDFKDYNVSSIANNNRRKKHESILERE